ncbi:MAG: hypothetical protein AAF639_36555 [Chloroflexota bacterium]
MLVQDKVKLEESNSIQFIVGDFDESEQSEISAETARQQVDRWLRDEVAMLLMAREPSLVGLHLKVG